MKSRQGAKMLYIGFYWFWKVGDVAAVSFSLGLTREQNSQLNQSHNVSALTPLFETKFKEMTLGFSILAAISSTIFVTMILLGEEYYFIIILSPCSSDNS